MSREETADSGQYGAAAHSEAGVTRRVPRGHLASHCCRRPHTASHLYLLETWVQHVLLCWVGKLGQPPEVNRPPAEYYANKGRRKLKEELIGWEPVIQSEVRKRKPNIVY